MLFGVFQRTPQLHVSRFHLIIETCCTVLSGRYTESCDLWSMGVIMYMLVSGAPPFWGSSDAEIREKILKGAFSFPPQGFKVLTIPMMDS